MSYAVQIGNATVCYEPMEEIRREPDGERWCFYCHKRRDFVFVVTAPKDRYSYYGPNATIKCTICKTSDGDCFPGRYRIWEDES